MSEQTTAQEWTRLTPDDDPLGNRYCAVSMLSNGNYLIAVAIQGDDGLKERPGSHGFCLSPIEALAFARQLPEVRALVEACQNAPLATIAHERDKLGGGGDVIRPIIAALRPFTEPAGG